MIPADVQSDSDLILWMLRLHQSFEFEIGNRTKDYYNVEEVAKQTELEKLKLIQEMKDLEKESITLSVKDQCNIFNSSLISIIFFRNLKEQVSKKFSFLKREQSVNKVFPGID
jgi:hypothetical protein